MDVNTEQWTKLTGKRWVHLKQELKERCTDTMNHLNDKWAMRRMWICVSGLQLPEFSKNSPGRIQEIVVQKHKPANSYLVSTSAFHSAGPTAATFPLHMCVRLHTFTSTPPPCKEDGQSMDLHEKCLCEDGCHLLASACTFFPLPDAHLCRKVPSWNRACSFPLPQMSACVYSSQTSSWRILADFWDIWRPMVEDTAWGMQPKKCGPVYTWKWFYNKENLNSH